MQTLHFCPAISAWPAGVFGFAVAHAVRATAAAKQTSRAALRVFFTLFAIM
jgi:hypothetical protein